MKKLAIVCGAPSSEMLAPFNDPDYEVWVLGNRCDKYPRFDRIFEIHDDLTQHQYGYEQWLVDKNVPLVVGELFPELSSNVEIYPYDETVELFGSLYLTSSSACMLAYALLHGYDHIELYGVDMAVDDHEYFWQRPCMEAWIGFAKGRGVTVVIPDVSPLGKSDYVEGRDYGRERAAFVVPDNDYAAMAQLHAEHAQAICDQLNELAPVLDQIDNLKARIAAHDGAKQAYERMSKVARAHEAGQDIKLTNSVVIQ